MNCTSETPQSIVVCRLCMKSHEYFVNIFISNESFEIIVEESIQDVLGLPVAVGDGLPNVVCRLCLRKLIEFREFKNMCFKSATELRAYALGSDMISHAEEELWSSEKALLVKEEVNEGGNYTEGGVPVTALTSVAVDPLAFDTMCPVKDEFLPMQLLGKATSGTWSSCMYSESLGAVAPNDLTLDPLALENQTDTKEVYPRDPLGESDDCGEDLAEIQFNEDAAVCSESKLLLMDDQSLKEEAQEPKGAAGEGYSLGDTSPHDHIQVTEVFVPVPDQLAMGIVGHVEEDARPTELMVKEEIGEGLDSSENDVPVVSLSSVNVDPLAVDSTIDIKVDDDIKTGDCSLNIEVMREERLLENEVSGKKCSGGGAPLSKTKAENQVDCFNYIGGIPEVPEINLDKFVSGWQENSQHQLPSNSSCDHMPEENLQFEYSTDSSLVAHCHSATTVKRKENMKPSDSNKIASLLKNSKQLECDVCGKNFRYGSDFKKHSVIHTGVKQHRCDVCGKMFNRKGNLKSHSIIHTGVKPFKCNVCGKSFTEKSSLKKHLAIHTREKAFKCNACGKNFRVKSTLKRHLVIHADVKPYKCAVCGKMFTQVSGLNAHSFVHTGVKPFRCEVCGKTFTRNCYLATHSKIHTGEKTFKCDVCGKNFRVKSSLKKHLAIHTGVKAFKCNECGKKFTENSNLNKHLLIHTGVKPYKCAVCGKVFTQSSYLKSHSVVHTGVKPFLCAVCGKTFTRSGDLATHSVIHTGAKPFKCNVCGKNFRLKSRLESHSVFHTGVKPFKCDLCGKTFTRSCTLALHLFIHTGEKPFKCNVCGKNFRVKSSLKRHLVIHTGVRPFKCNVCGKNFSLKGTLKMHSLTHTCVKPYKCKVCGKMFTRSDRLKIHSEIHTGEKSFSCNVCGKNFTENRMLKTHLVIHTGMEPYKCDLCGKEYKWKGNLCGHLLTHGNPTPPK